jgi:hypothetical protein
VSQRCDDVLLPEVVQGGRIAQTFVCERDGLCRIDVKVANANEGRSLRHLVFRVYDDSGDGPRTEIAAHRVMQWHVIDDGWVAVPVPAQARSTGRRYTIVIETPDAQAGDAVRPKASAHRTYDKGDLMIDGAPADGSLCFQTYCRTEAAGGDVQTGEDTLMRVDMTPAADGRASADRAIASLAEQQWEQTRYLASAVSAGLDAVREQMRADHAELLELQRQTLRASTEKMLSRAVRENALVRALRRGRRKPTS